MDDAGAREIRAYWGTSWDSGGCSNCWRYFLSGYSNRKHQVLIVDLTGRQQSFRLCQDCLDLMLAQIKQAKKGKQKANSNNK